ncbi:MAG: hypothetical protein LKG80_08080 [Lachnospiraceae bacterium]|jgi:hypothetical protein|nr:hypothetical protein [Lachnospiraceae bacterium]MCH4030051.1 hypothetical protein [Lachnospiraceae bacterium]MCH4070289.1 hypothetical protein [Lachnospiraceae bacterium]MCH4107801.1 hypothetical protein [Lachnospiraceae bacterium]MCI1361502.1 hypothetical protein [Lachnospiraceae bacterium]
MKRYCVIEKGLSKNHAGSKARNDVAKILVSSGWKTLTVHHIEGKPSVHDKLRMIPIVRRDWQNVTEEIEPDSQLLIQYPLAMYPKVSLFAIPYIKKLKNNRVKLIYLIHDLDSLRGVNEDVEEKFLLEADQLIVHNQAMQNYLVKKGYPEERTVILGLFDYLVPEPVNFSVKHAAKNTIVIAGNLDREKAGYVYQLDKLGNALHFTLYGPNYGGAEKTDNAVYLGQLTPDEMPQKLDGGFGIVWDGPSLDTCSGAFGQYLRFNNPHKASLYIASGIPLIVWDKSALAGFVQKNGIGITVSSLYEASLKILHLDDEVYDNMRKNVRALAGKLWKGEFLQHALEEKM